MMKSFSSCDFCEGYATDGQAACHMLKAALPGIIISTPKSTAGGSSAGRTRAARNTSFEALVNLPFGHGYSSGRIIEVCPVFYP
jgi:hypothetical protein